MNTPRFISTLAATLLLAVTSASFGQTMPATVTRHAGEHEITIGGAGASNKELSDSFGGINFSYGWYTSETQEFVLRQSINYSNPRGRSQEWNGSTRLAFDQHFAARGMLRPFAGVNFGGVYGDGVSDTFAAGLEGGAKFYVHPQTFVYAMAEYGWFFRHASSVRNRFNDGQFNWGVGIGYNF